MLLSFKMGSVVVVVIIVFQKNVSPVVYIKLLASVYLITETSEPYSVDQ